MKPLIVANWKMNPQTLTEAKALFNLVEKGIRNIKKVKVVICPPFVYLPSLKPKFSKLGAQDVFWEEAGAYTGEVSPLMLKNLNCQYIIIGHSERRKYFSETDQIINKKLKITISAGLIPILCIGETKRERKSGQTFVILKNQLQKGLVGISSSLFSRSLLVLAYEPVWAIGTGIPCSLKEAKEVLQFLKKQFPQTKTLPILYGGSVKANNALDYIKVGFDGLLVGGASLDPKQFIEIIKAAS